MAIPQLKLTAAQEQQAFGYEIRDSKTEEGTIEAWGYTEVELEEMARMAAIEREVRELKKNLADTDYEAIKFAEGWITAEEYAPIKAQREAWRERIRELENN